jgi:hypothetical protein
MSMRAREGRTIQVEHNGKEMYVIKHSNCPDNPGRVEYSAGLKLDGAKALTRDIRNAIFFATRKAASYLAPMSLRTDFSKPVRHYQCPGP